MKIILAATLGDAAGIGPEVAQAAIFPFLESQSDVEIILMGPEETFKTWRSHPRLRLRPTPLRRRICLGKPTLATAAQALQDLDQATTLCLEGKAHALVTGPLDKFWCSKVRKSFRGHTEYLQERAKVAGTTMMLASSKMRIVLVTTHLPLRKVASAITKPKLESTILRTWNYVRSIELDPRLAVCGLNPHASDNGLFGDEEAKIIQPVIRKLTKKGLSLVGPVAADSLFHRASDYSAIVCMYHDQGLIPIKQESFFNAVNITLGLPFLRTSVDHGTAFDIAGAGKASSISYGKALESAADWVRISQLSQSHSSSRRMRT